MRPTDFDRIKLDRALVVLLHRLAWADISKRVRISSHNRQCLRDDAEAICHLLEFAEYAIKQLNIGGEHAERRSRRGIAGQPPAAPQSPRLGGISVRPAWLADAGADTAEQLLDEIDSNTAKLRVMLENHRAAKSKL
jgi:hypothetical protein